MKKMTKSEWDIKFETEFKPRITEFCKKSSGTTLFGNDNITAELKAACWSVIHDNYFVQLEIKPIVEHLPHTTQFLLTDYNNVTFFASEYYQGTLSIGVMQGRKVVCGHTFNIADTSSSRKLYTKDGESTRELMEIIRYYVALFKATMDMQNYIKQITGLAGKKNI